MLCENCCFRNKCLTVSDSLFCCVETGDHELTCSHVAGAALLVFPGPTEPGHPPAGRTPDWSPDPSQPSPPPPARYLHCRVLPHLTRPPGLRRGSGGDARREAGPARCEQVTGYSSQPPPQNALEQHRGKKVCIMSCQGSVVVLTFGIKTSCPTS